MAKKSTTKRKAKHGDWGNVWCPFCNKQTSVQTHLEICAHCDVEFYLNDDGDYIFDSNRKTDVTTKWKFAKCFIGVRIGNLQEVTEDDVD